MDIFLDLRLGRAFARPGLRVSFGVERPQAAQPSRLRFSPFSSTSLKSFLLEVLKVNHIETDRKPSVVDRHCIYIVFLLAGQWRTNAMHGVNRSFWKIHDVWGVGTGYVRHNASHSFNPSTPMRVAYPVLNFMHEFDCRSRAPVHSFATTPAAPSASRQAIGL